VAFVGTGRLDPGRAARAEASMAEFQAYLEPLIARRGTDPGLDLISLLLRRRPRRSTSASSSARA
jgi:cytochrome P450